MPRFTKSKDGVERCTVRVKLRLTRQEVEVAKATAVKLRGDGKQWRDVLDSYAALGVDLEMDIFSYENDMERNHPELKEGSK